jgi:CHAT domain-containing protein/Flp pilus assembly protein TadD
MTLALMMTALCPLGVLPVRADASPIAPRFAQADSRQVQADRLLEQGTQQYRTGQPTEAIATLQQVLTLYQALADQPKIVKTLRNLGNAYYVMTNYSQAIAYYQQSLELARKNGDRAGEAAALGNLGVIAINLGETAKATTYYQQALLLYRETKDRQGEGQTIGNLAQLAYNRGDYPGAIAAYEQAIAIAREITDRQLEANSLGSLGVVYYSLSDYAKAITYSQQQLTIARSLQDRLGESAALNNLGNTFYALGDYGQAIAFLDQRLMLSHEIEDRLGEAQALGNLSGLYSDLGDYSRAIGYAFKGLAIATAIQNSAMEAPFLTKLGNLYYVSQNFPKAIEYHEKRLTVARATNDANSIGISFTNLGNVYRSMGQYAKAIDYHQQALVLARQTNDKPGESTILANLGVEYDEQGQFDQAIATHRQALAISRAIQDPATEGLVLNNLGNTLFKAKKYAEAEATLQAGLKTWESLRANLGNNDRNQISLFDQQVRTYRLLQRVLVAQKKTDAALEIAERGRARAFVQLLARRLAESDPHPNARSPLTNDPPPTIAQIKQIAKAQNSTLVQYSITYEDRLVNGKISPREAALYIWVIAPNGTITFRTVNLTALGTDFAIDELVSNSREGMGVSGRGTAGTPSQVAETPSVRRARRATTQLYTLLIQPIADALPTDPNARVTFIPQRSLFLVPFAALQDPSGQYLIQRHTILTAPSIQVLGLTQQQRERRGERGEERGVRKQGTAPDSRLPTPHSLVVGNPTMPFVSLQNGEPPEQLASLPGAELEAMAIAPLLGTQAITGDRATKAAIVQQMPQERIIHLATHGLLDDFKGLGIPGAIALAPSGSDNGLLTADEILDLKLNAELVVLSACDTGRGRLTGDGVIGLSRSFIAAGVPSLVVSLWAVPDASTAFLMTEFYQNFQKKPDKAQALRQAMLATLKKYPNPKEWAAFTLIGEAE